MILAYAFGYSQRELLLSVTQKKNLNGNTYRVLKVMSRAVLYVIIIVKITHYMHDNLNNNVMIHMYYLYIMSAKYTNQRCDNSMFIPAHPPSSNRAFLRERTARLHKI